MAQSRIAEAYVQIVPTMGGASSAISAELATAGTAGSAAFGGNFTKGLAGIAGAVGAAFAINKVVDFTGVLVEAAQAEVEQNARIQNIAQSMGLFGGETDNVVKRLLDFASTQQLANGLDEDAIKLTQAKLLTFKNVAATAGDMGGMFDRATMAAQDLAAAGFGTAESNAVALGKALNDPLKGVTALSRMGVTFTEEQKGMIESLMETGDVAGAQALIMKELETQVGGTAVAITTNSDKLDQSWSNLQETLGLALLPVVESFAGIVKPVADWFAQTPGAVGALIAVVATFTAVMAALAVVFIFVTIQTWAMNIALLANPITWIVLAVVAAVGLLIGIIILLVNNWEAVAKWFQDVFGPVFEWLGGIFNWLWEYAIKPVIDFVAAAFQWLWDYIIKPIIDFIVIYIMIWAAIITWLWEYVLAPVFGFIGEIFEWIWNYVIKPVVDFIVAYIEMMGMVFEWLYKNIIKPVFDSIAEVFNWIWKTIIKPVFDWIASAVNAVGKVFSDVFGAVASFIRDTFNNIVNFIKIPINAVIGFINMMIDGINSISIEVPDWINDLLGTNVQSIGFNIPKLPALAAGGYVDQPTMALIGEAGPEVVTPLKDFERMMGIGNGGGTVNYYAAPNESIDSEQALFDAMRRAKVVAGW